MITPHTKRELIYLGLVVVCLAGMFATFLIVTPMIESYQEATYKCYQTIADFNSNYADVYGRPLNLTEVQYATNK